MFVDNTNLRAGLEENDDTFLTLHKGQHAVSQWGNSLIAVRGEFKQSKYVYTVHNMVPSEIGDWVYPDAAASQLATTKEKSVMKRAATN